MQATEKGAPGNGGGVPRGSGASPNVGGRGHGPMRLTSGEIEEGEIRESGEVD